MGGAVSDGRDNNDLVDNLVESRYIKTDIVEKVFRAVDRADYVLPSHRKNAYKDHAWRFEKLHLSAPCVYSDVMEGLELKAGLSFLNLGSGTGYLSTLAGLILGTGGINHGIEIHSTNVDYANLKLQQFILNSLAVDEFDFCVPHFFVGNCLCLPPTIRQYDRVYCGAGCGEGYEDYLKNLIKVGGYLVIPLEGKLLQIKKLSDSEWVTKKIQSVSYSMLQLPSSQEEKQVYPVPDIAPAPLQILCRTLIRNVLRDAVLEEHPNLRKTPLKPKKFKCKRKLGETRRIYIPINEGGLFDFNELHNLDNETGSREMNALLSLVMRMGDNRADMDGLSDDSDDTFTDEHTDSHLSDVSHLSEFVNLYDSISISSDDAQLAVPSNENNATVAEASSKTQPTTESNPVDVATTSSKTASSSTTEISSNTTKTAKNTNCRKKLDSGIVEDEVTGCAEDNSLSPDTSVSEHMNTNSSEEYLSDNEVKQASERPETATKLRRSRRLRKRHYSEGATELQHLDEDGYSSDRESEYTAVESNKIKKMKRKSPPPGNPHDIQRELLAKYLLEKVRKLPLPPPLKVFVNMGRSF